ILLRQKQKKLIMLPSETMIWQPEFTDKTLSRKPGAVQNVVSVPFSEALQESEFFSQILHSQTQLSTPWQWPKYEVAQDH
ncbi:hypothetical protein K9T73_00135, partial [Escherichia coli]